METNPKPDFPAMVQCSSCGPESDDRRPWHRPVRWSQAHSPARGIVSEALGQVQQEAANARPAHGECGNSAAVYNPEGKDTPCQHR